LLEISLPSPAQPEFGWRVLAFMGGEFVLTEQRPRMQSRAHVVPLDDE
jgi:hypothetical protein